MYIHDVIHQQLSFLPHCMRVFFCYSYCIIIVHYQCHSTCTSVPVSFTVVSKNQLTELDTSKLPNLKKLSFNSNKLSAFPNLSVSHIPLKKVLSPSDGLTHFSLELTCQNYDNELCYLNQI